MPTRRDRWTSSREWLDLIRSAATALLIGPILAGAAGAADLEPPGDDQGSLAPVTVTVRRIPEDRDKAPAAVGVVEGGEIQPGRLQLGLGESLVRIPGLFVQNRFNFAQGLRLSSRGFGARSGFGIRGLKVFVDGIPATLADGQTQLDGIDPGTVGRIEVMRGPASSLYGPAAGGVFQIATEEPPEDPFVEGQATFGEYGFQRYRLKAGGRAKSVGYFASLSHLGLEGYRDQSGTRASILSARLSWDIDGSSDLSVLVSATDSPKADDPGGLTREEVRRDRRQASPRNLLFDAGEEMDQQKLGLVYRRSFGEKHEISARNYYVLRDVENRLPFVEGGSVELDRLFAGGGLQYLYTDTLLGRRAWLALGLDVDAQRDDRRRFDNLFGSRGAVSLDQDEDVTAYGAYLQNRVELPGSLELSGGVRYDRVVFQVDDHFLSDGDQSDRIHFDRLSPAVALLFGPIPELNAYAGVSTSFETPTTTELANPLGTGGFNPDLDPQKAINYEVGLKGLVRGRLRYDVALFRVEADNELVPFERPDQPERSFFRNAGRSTRNGIEVGLGVEPLPGLVAELAYTFSDFDYDHYQTPAGVFDGNEIPGIPRSQLFAEISYRHPSGFFAAWDALYVDRLFADDANAVETGSYWVSSLRVGRRFQLGRFSVTPFAGVENLFGREYDGNVRINAAAGRYFEPAPDRNLYGGLSVRYDFGG
jgi:iron complex outermembrane receptor protein